jgi:predicted transcriptional regulator
MRKLVAAIAVIATIATVPVVEAKATPIQFDTPAQVLGKATISAEWALILVGSEAKLVGRIYMPQSVDVTNLTQHSVIVHDESQTGQELPLVAPHRIELGRLPSLDATLTGNTLSSIFVQGKIRLDVDRMHGALVATAGQSCISNYVSAAQYHSQSARFQNLCPISNVVLDVRGQNATSMSMISENVTVVEYHNMFLCGYKFCWDADDRQEARQSFSPGPSLHTRTLRFHELRSVRGTAQIDAAGAQIILGGAQISYLGQGDARLPLVVGSCSECTNQTWTLQGAFSLSNVTKGDDHGRLAAEYSGHLKSLRLDESDFPVVPVASLAGATAIAAISTIVKFLIAPFFTRLSKDEALEHPRRKQIFEYVQRNPGTNFREISRMTGIAAGTVRHHLNVLERSELLVEHQHGSTIRLFENHGKFDRNWSDVVLLREASLGALHAWLVEHPGSSQKAVLAGMEALGWSRSTTQHRLARLVEGGLASIRLQGRLKIYSATGAAQVVKPLLPALPA